MKPKLNRKSTYQLLDVARQSYQRHLMIADHLQIHFDVDYNVFCKDPLLTCAIEALSDIIRDKGLLFWWLAHDPGNTFYNEDEILGGCEIETAKQLLEYYYESKNQERWADTQ